MVNLHGLQKNAREGRREDRREGRMRIVTSGQGLGLGVV